MGWGLGGPAGVALGGCVLRGPAVGVRARGRAPRRGGAGTAGSNAALPASGRSRPRRSLTAHDRSAAAGALRVSGWPRPGRSDPGPGRTRGRSQETRIAARLGARPGGSCGLAGFPRPEGGEGSRSGGDHDRDGCRLDQRTRWWPPRRSRPRPRQRLFIVQFRQRRVGFLAARTLCWFDLSSYNASSAGGAAGQSVSVALPGGYSIGFTLLESGGQVKATGFPTYGGAPIWVTGPIRG